MIFISELKEWVKNIVLIILFANFIEMLLPNSKFRGYIRVVIGFFVILVIMVPIINILNFRTTNLNLSLINSNQDRNLENIIATGNQIRKEEIRKAKKKYKNKLTKQIEAIIKLNSQFDDFQIEVDLNDGNQIKQVIVDTNYKEVTSVQVDINKSNQKVDKSQKQRNNLKQLLLNLYGLNKEQVLIK